MVYNILFHIQSMVHHNDRLLLMVIWARSVHVLNSVRIIANKVLRIHNRGGVPRDYLTPKRGGCNGCTRKSMEQQAEVVPAKSATMKQVWRPKQVVSSSA